MFLVAADETLCHGVKFSPHMKTVFVWLTDEYLLRFVISVFKRQVSVAVAGFLMIVPLGK
jgi:hypothetical protein